LSSLGARPAVSILMPVYNGEKFLSSAISSILKQTFDDWELIVIDDGSTDETPLVLQNLRQNDHRIRVLTNQVCQGIASSLNRSAACAKARLLARMDVDDVAYRDRLQAQVNEFNEHPNLVLCGSNAVHVDSEMRLLFRTTLPSSDIEIRELAFFENPFVHSSVMIKAEAFNAVGGYRQGLDVTQDYELWIRLFSRGEVKNLMQPYVALRRHTDSVSHSKHHAQSRRAAEVQSVYALKKLKTIDWDPNRFENIRHYIYRQSVSPSGVQCSGEESLKNAVQLVEAVIRCRPMLCESKVHEHIFGRCLIASFRLPLDWKKSVIALTVLRRHGVSALKGAVRLLGLLIRYHILFRMTHRSWESALGEGDVATKT